MAWVRIDDHLHSNPKLNYVWTLENASVGAYLFALSFSAAHLTDGAVDKKFVQTLFPRSPRRYRRTVDALVEARLWVPDGDGWQIHDYLDYNDSRELITERRRRREAKRRANWERLDDAR